MTRTLSEAASKARLSGSGVPFLPEESVTDAAAGAEAAVRLGLPVVAKLNGDAIAHKTERGLVRLDLASADAVATATDELLAAATPDDGAVSVLIAPMVQSNRELIAGVSVDPQFGPTVLLGVGGILAEALADVSIRLAPIDRVDGHDMLDELDTQQLLGEFRGEPAIDRDAVVDLLMCLSAVAVEPDVVSVDLNPVLITDGRPVAVDALVEITTGPGGAR